MIKKQDKLQKWAKELSSSKEIIEINVLKIPTITNQDGELIDTYKKYSYNFSYKDDSVCKAYTQAGFEFLYYDEEKKKLWLKNRNFNKDFQKSSIDIYPIKEILDKKFFVPLYQRGYKWDKQQAIDLLDDIDEFISKNERDGNETLGEIYCIQPLVVKKDIDKWDVVDGQQRLTTIYLLLHYLDKDKNKYIIEYEKESQNKNGEGFAEKRENYLSDPKDDLKMNNIDYYHINLVWHTINDWFSNKDDNYKKIFIKTLLDNVSFIWYEIGEEEDPIKVFERLNIGKIPLTDSELIKALFLNQNNFDTIEKDSLERQQKEIAMQWDQIEYNLQNDEFWCFLHNDKSEEYKQPTRIDFIFKLIMQGDKLKVINNDSSIKDKIGNDNHKIFRYFYEGFKTHFKNFIDNNSLKDWLLIVWQGVENYYQIFREWFNDYRIYHYIGYLTICKHDLNFDYTIKGRQYSNNLASIVCLWENSLNKEDFISHLKAMIKKGLSSLKFATKTKLDKWVFEENKKNEGEKKESTTAKAKCRPILLLHNIETILKRNEGLVKKYSMPEFTRFPFHLFQREAWEVEHIRSNARDDVKDRNKQECFLAYTRDYLAEDKEKYQSIIEDIDKFLKCESDSKTFEALCGELNTIEGNGKISALGNEDKNKIWNYTLLDSATNEEYHNNIFPIKRAYILNKENGIKIELTLVKDDTTGGYNRVKKTSETIAFIPPCTKNIFTKAYSIQDANIGVWTQSNAKDYLQDMIDKLDFYLGE